MSELVSAAEAFVMTEQSRQDATIVTITEPDANGEEPALTATEQLATYFYEDVRQVLRRAGFDLSRELGAPPEYADDAELFLRLLCADMERLWQYQLITGLALMLTTPIERLGDPHAVLYRAIYRVRQSLDVEQGSVRLRPVLRLSDGLGDSISAATGARAFLVAEWTRDAALRRVPVRPPRYHFAWVPTQPALFDENALPLAQRYDALAPASGDLTLLQIAAE
ncbi:MAG: hypothetical protein IVW57_17150 [Ktedonobacterales bacterium]|nr:hypothetical protein [Ktedonobacterales bacterium]